LRANRLGLLAVLFGELLDGGEGSALAAVEELDAAEAAMVELASGKALENVERAYHHGIDFIGGAQLGDAIGAALGTARMFAHVIGIAAGDKLFVLAIPALIDGKVAEAFEECPVHPFEAVAAAISALSHCACYTSIAPAGQLQTQW
jgi:hypothetical protein